MPYKIQANLSIQQKVCNIYLNKHNFYINNHNYAFLQEQKFIFHCFQNLQMQFGSKIGSTILFIYERNTNSIFQTYDLVEKKEIINSKFIITEAL